MDTNSIFLSYMTLLFIRLGGIPHHSWPMGKYFQHQAFQATWTSENREHRAVSMSPEEEISLSPLKYNWQEYSFPMRNFSGSFSLISFPRKHCNPCVFLHTIFSVVQNWAFRIQWAYDQAVVILNLLLLTVTKHLFSWNHVVSKIVLISIQSFSDGDGYKSQGSFKNWKALAWP